MKFVRKENFEPKIKLIIENVQNFINKKTNKPKVLNFVLTLGRIWRVKKAPKLSSEYLNFLANS